MKDLFTTWGTETLQLENFGFSDRGTCTLFLEDDLQIDFEYPETGDDVFLYVALPNREEPPLNILLEANYRFHRDVNFRFGYDSQANEYLLIGTIPKSIESVDLLDSTVAGFVQIVKDFLDDTGDEQPQGPGPLNPEQFA